MSALDRLWLAFIQSRSMYDPAGYWRPVVYGMRVVRGGVSPSGKERGE